MKFSFDSKQTVDVENWIYQHPCKVLDNQGAVGGRITFSFTPTQLGVVEKVSCACGAEIDVTDYESW